MQRAEDAAGLGVDARLLPLEQHLELVLSRLVEAEALGDVRDLARAVVHARGLHDDVDRRGDLRAHRRQRQLDVRHEAERLEAVQRVVRIGRVHRRQRAAVARRHRLDEVERLAAAALADDDAIGPHT
jgi:hypothetical protein